MTDLPQLWTDEERWQVLMESVKDFGIFMLDPYGNIATWNAGAERVLGYTEDEFIGRPFSAIFTAQDIQMEQPEFELREAREKGRCEDERWHVRKDGSLFWASGVVTPLWSEDGGLRGYAKVVRDITERKLSEIAVNDANRRKDEFLAILSHEFRNPLAAISYATELIKLEAKKNSDIAGAVEVIDRQAAGLVHMVDDLLDISRITGGKLQLERQRVDLGEIVLHALEVAKPMLHTRCHNVQHTPSGEAIWVDGDPHRLKQLIANLIVNAAKYTDPGGRIEITLTRQGNQAKLSVKDNGAGILSEMLPRIFELFVQADRSRDRSQGGLGIGLALVKRLVEMHGGAVEAFSEGIGKGSEFVVRLPVIAEVKAPTQPDAKGVAPTSAGMRIIIAEDNTDTAESMAMILRRYSHEVTIVSSGTDALRVAGEVRPDILILDIGLPGMDGYRVAQTIRAQDELKGIRLIAVTGYGQSEDQEKSKQAGFDVHLVKPVDFANLLKVLDARS